VSLYKRSGVVSEQTDCQQSPPHKQNFDTLSSLSIESTTLFTWHHDISD
jgi:hypothetical protein